MSVQHIVPPEVASNIVQHAAGDRQTIFLLTRISRSFQEAAEKALYEQVEVYPHPRYYPLIRTLSSCSRVTGYVRFFTMARTNIPIPSDFWEAIRKIVVRLRDLDRFIFEDQTMQNGWVLAPPQGQAADDNKSWTLSAEEARISVPWDENVTAFLNTQDRLRSLQVLAGALENVPMASLWTGALPLLTHFEGPLMVADQLLQCGVSLTHFKVILESEDDISLLPLVVPSLNRLPKLRSLAITHLPPEMACSTVSAICRNCPNLQYLGYLPLPMEHRPRMSVMKMLGRLPRLAYVEFDVRHWTPPVAGLFQRPFAVELLMVARSLRSVFFWNVVDRGCWTWHPESVPTLTNTEQEVQGGHAASGNTNTNFVGVEGWRHQFQPTNYTFCTFTWRSVV